jgi:hypothetical protein
MLLSVDPKDPIGPYRHSWKGFNTKESNLQRLRGYYEARAEDRSKITYRFRPNNMKIHIFIHQRVPTQEFKPLLLQFFEAKSSENVVSNENIEIRAGGSQVSGDPQNPHNMHPDYKVLDANETNGERIVRLYDERAVDRSWIRCQYNQVGVDMYMIVHRRVPLQEFKTLAEDVLYHCGFDADIAGDENVEMLYNKYDRGEQDLPGDWEVEDGEESG